jgi:mannose/fructose/N-acetylgalactosamine-specific phosphotransferase system component IIC
MRYFLIGFVATYAMMRPMESIALVAIFVVTFAIYGALDKRKARKAQEEAERAKQPKEYDGRGGPRDPIHDLMID